MSTRPTTNPSNLRDDFNRFLAKPDVPLADFVTPLSLEECIERLYGMRVAWRDTTIDVQIKMLDVNQHSFQLHMYRKRGRRIIDDSVIGTLQREDTQTTRITIMRHYTPAELIVWTRAIVIAAIILLVIFVLHKLLFVMFLIILGLALLENNHRAIANAIKQSLAVSVSPDSP